MTHKPARADPGPRRVASPVTPAIPKNPARARSTKAPARKRRGKALRTRASGSESETETPVKPEFELEAAEQPRNVTKQKAEKNMEMYSGKTTKLTKERKLGHREAKTRRARLRAPNAVRPRRSRDAARRIPRQPQTRCKNIAYAIHNRSGQTDERTRTATAPRSSLSPELPPTHTLEAAHARHTVRWNSTPPDIRM